MFSVNDYEAYKGKMRKIRFCGVGEYNDGIGLKHHRVVPKGHLTKAYGGAQLEQKRRRS